MCSLNFFDLSSEWHIILGDTTKFAEEIGTLEF